MILILIEGGCNIIIWRTFQRQSIALQEQNRVLQNQRMTKTLLLVPTVALLSWLPLTICFLLTRVIEVLMPFHIFLIAVFLCYSNSFFNPLVCALRIPEFRQALVLWYFRRQEAMDVQRNERRVNMAAGLTPTYS